MNAREFYYAVVRMRFAQRLQEQMPCGEATKHRKIELEAIVDAEIKRVEVRLKQEAEQQQKLL